MNERKIFFCGWKKDTKCLRKSNEISESVRKNPDLALLHDWQKIHIKNSNLYSNCDREPNFSLIPKCICPVKNKYSWPPTSEFSIYRFKSNWTQGWLKCRRGPQAQEESVNYTILGERLEIHRDSGFCECPGTKHLTDIEGRLYLTCHIISGWVRIPCYYYYYYLSAWVFIMVWGLHSSCN